MMFLHSSDMRSADIWLATLPSGGSVALNRE